MTCDSRQLTQAQREEGFDQSRTGVVQAVRPFSGTATPENIVDYINRELFPVVKQTRQKVNDVYLPVTDNAPSGNPLAFFFSTETGAADPTTGRLRLNASPQNTSTTIRVSQTNMRLSDVGPWLDVMQGSATEPLGTLTLSDIANPTRFLRFDLETMVDQGTYWELGVTIIESSHDDPFVEDEAVMLGFVPAAAAAGATVPPDAISPIATDTFIGNISGSTAAPVAVPLADIDSVSVIYDLSSHTFQRAALTGDVTATQNSNATTIANDAVTNPKLRNSGPLSVIGRAVNVSGDPADISATAGSNGVLRESGSVLGFGTIALAAFPSIADDTFLANISGASAPPTAVALTTLAGAGLTGGADAILAVGAGTGITVNANDVQLTPIADDTFMANVSGSSAVATGKSFSSLAGDGLTYDATNHELDVVGSTSITVTGDQVQRAALTGAIAASLDGNATVFAGIRVNGGATTDRTNLNLVNSTSILPDLADDAGNDEIEIGFQRAALTGAISAAQNSNATEFSGIRWNGGFTNAVGFLNFIDSTSIAVVMADDPGNDETEIQFQRAALTGFAAASANSNATTSAEPIVTYTASANMSAERVLSNGANTTVSTAVAGQISVGVDDLPLTALADQADDTFLANISGASAPPTAVALTTLAGAGLTGGADAVLAVGAGTGITVNANDVQLAAGAAESFLGNFTSGSAVADYRAGSSVAGGGLTYTAGGTLAVGAGTGITVNANDVAVNTAADFTWTGAHNFSGAVLWTDDHVESGALPLSITIGDTVNKLFINTAGDGNVTAINGTTSAGRIVRCYLLASGTKTFTHGTGAGSMQWPGSRNHVLGQGQSFTLIGNNPGAGWRVSDVPVEVTDKGDITVNSTGATWTIDNNVVSDAKLRDSAALSVIGRSANSTGDPADIVAGTDGHALRRSGTTLGFGTVANAGLADMAANTIKSNATGSTAAPQDLAISANSFPARVGGNLVSHPFSTLAGDALDYDAGVIDVLVDNDRDIRIDDTTGQLFFRKSRRRHHWWEDFDHVQNANLSVLASTAVDLGQTNWRAIGITSTGTIVGTLGENNHPGIVTLASGFVIGDGVRLFRGEIDNGGTYLGQDVFMFEAIVRLPTVTTMTWQLGLEDADADNNIIFRGVTVTDTTTHTVTTEGGSATEDDTGSTFTAGEWNVYTILQETLGTIDFYIDDVLETTHTTNVPDAEEMSVFFQVTTLALASRTMDIDYCYFETNDLGARTS